MHPLTLRLQQVPNLLQQLGVGIRFGGGLFLFFAQVQGIQAFDEEENGEGNQYKLDDGVDDGADAEGHLAYMKNPGFTRKGTTQGANGGHEEAVDDGVYDGLEGRADDDADGEVEGVALEGEGFEFGEEGHA